VISQAGAARETAASVFRIEHAQIKKPTGNLARVSLKLHGDFGLPRGNSIRQGVFDIEEFAGMFLVAILMPGSA